MSNLYRSFRSCYFFRLQLAKNFSKQFLLSLILIGSLFSNADGQMLATWSNTNANTPMTLSAFGANINSGATVTDRFGLTYSANTNRYSSTGWHTTLNYLTVTLTPASGYVLNLNSGSFAASMGSSGTGPGSANGYLLFSSVDNYASSIGTLTPSCSGQLLNTITLPSSGFNNLSSITFRIVANNPTGATANCNATAPVASGGTGGPSSIVINGATAVAPPVITSSLSTTTYYGTSSTYNITATSATSITGYNATGLPAGLSINTSSGAITGTTTSAVTPGNYPVTISATNMGGGTTNATLTYTVSPKPITITATGPLMTYGNPLSTAAGTSFSITSGTMAFSETITSVTLTPDANGQSTTIPAGSAYSVEPSAATGAGGFLTSNYNITYVNYNGTVAKKAVTITANTVYKSQGTALTTPVTNNTDFNVTGLENGQTVGSITMAYDVTAGTGGGSASAVAGSYPSQATPSAATGGTFNINNYNITYVAGTIQVISGTIPVIATSGTPAALSTNVGTASAFTSFNVSGTNMLGGILVTPPTGFEVSLTSGGSYTATVTVGAAGTIASTPVYIRLRSTTPAGTYSGFIVCSSTNANNENVVMPASTVNALAPTLQAFNIVFSNVTSLSFTASWTNGNGGRRVVFINDGTGFASNPVDGTHYTPDATFGAGSEIGSGFYCIYDGTGTSVNVIGLTPGTTYTVQVFEYNSDDNSAPTATFIRYNTSTSGTNPRNQLTTTPTIAVSTFTLTGFAYYENYGPSASSSYLISATNLLTASGNITVSGTTDYEFSTDNLTFSSSISIPYTSYNLAFTTVYVRLKAGLSVGPYNGQQISNSGGGASSQTITCNGNVITPPSSSPILSWNLNDAVNLPGGSNNFGASPYTIYSTINAGISSSGLVRGPGLSSSGTGSANAWGGTAFSTSSTLATAIAGGSYFSFTVATNANYITSLFFIDAYRILRSATGPTLGQWQYQINSGAFVNIGSAISIPSGSTNFSSVSLGGISALQNLLNPNVVTFRLVLYGASSAGGTAYFNNLGNGNTADLLLYGIVDLYCAAANAIEFVQHPLDVNQDATLSPNVTVRAYCTGNLGTDKAYAGTVTLASADAPLYVCGLTGTLTQSFFNGVATYSNLKITRSGQTGVALKATSASLPVITSNTFNVIAPSGAPPSVNTIASDDFEAGVTWARAIGAPTYTGTGSGVDNTVIKTLGGNKALVKSFTVDNTSENGNNRASTTVITFANQTIASTVDYATFTFQVASLGDPSSPNGSGGFSGEGNDNGEDMTIEISLDGGTVWSKLLTYKGNDNYLVPFSPLPVTSLAYNANAVYVKNSQLSSFSVVLPTGSTQFRFRMTAKNNRINENWALDNIKLETTTISTGTQSPLPAVTDNPSVVTCPNTNTTISVVTGSTQGAVSYSWTAGGTGSIVGSATVSNPTISITGPGTGTFVANITDADGCRASGTVTVSVPGGSSGTWTGANNSDWFQCANWGGGVVPDNTINVTIPAAATNPADIDPLSTYSTAFSGIARAQNILIDGKSLTTQANANLNVAGNLTIQNTNGLLDMTNGGTVTFTGSWTKSGGAVFTSGAGTINYAGTNPQTIEAENYYNLTSSSTGSRTLQSSGTIGVANAFTPGGNTYSIGTSTVDFNGTSNQNPFISVPFTFYNIKFTTPSGSSTKTLGASISVQKTLTMGANTTFELSSGNVTLKSTSTATANVATVPSGAAIDQSGSGRFIIERYINDLRSWRLLTAPITTAQTINAAWMEGSTPVPTGASFPYASLYNQAAGFGTHISGPSPAANGFDKTPLDNYSIKYHNGSNWTGTGINPGTTDITSRPGWMLFIRGDRSYQILTTTSGTTPATTVLRTTGRINVGDRPVLTLAAGYNVVGNPYPSAIKMSSVTKVPATAANDIYYVWDPKINSGTSGQAVGGWIAMTRIGGTAYTKSAQSPSLIDTLEGRIESGVAIMINQANLTSVKIEEDDKSDASANTFFRPAAPQAFNPGSLRVTLFAHLGNGTVSVNDGSLILTDKLYSNKVDGGDALRADNGAEGFGIISNGKELSIEKRDEFKNKDTVFYNMIRARARNYRLVFEAGGISRPNLKGYIEDVYSKTSTALNMNGITQVEFSVNSDAGSYAKDRFRIVFKKSVSFAGIKAQPQSRNIAVDWNVEDENDVVRYEVEKSSDKVNYVSVGTVATDVKKRQSAYNLLDMDVAPGIYYYRVKAIGTPGEEYSEIAKVTVISGKSPMLIFPNPVTTGTINIQFNNQPQGIYSVRLLNADGRQIAVKNINHAGGTATQVFDPAHKLPAGIYQLKINGPGKAMFNLKAVIQQK